MNRKAFFQWRYSHVLSTPPGGVVWQRPLIMGVLNLTPDSFSDGGLYLKKENALQRAMQMIEEGVDIIDIGGESSRPGALSVSLDEELSRVIPIIEELVSKTDQCLSIDTTKPRVMQEAVAAGACMINDIAALRSDEALAVAVATKVPVCLMHMQGEPATMQDAPSYEEDVVEVVNNFFKENIQRCLEAGILFENLILDPGFGFGKNAQHNLRLVHRFQAFQVHRLPVLMGLSRKNTLGVVLNKPVNERTVGGLTAAIDASLKGAAIIRTHDVEETAQAFTMLDAIYKQSSQQPLTQGMGI